MQVWIKSRILVFLFITVLCTSIIANQFEVSRIAVKEELFDENILTEHPYGIQNTSRNYFPTDEWRICTPEEQGMNSTLLNEMLPYIESNNWPLDSIIVVRGGYIVYEEYPNPLFEMDDYHTLQSVTKSFTSALVGIAIREGFISSVNDTILDLFSDRNVTNVDERKERMSIKHLLTMTAGVEWDEWTYPYTDAENNSLAAMVTCHDAIDYFLNLPMVAEPGDEWVYNSGACIVLGVLIEELSNMTLVEFTQEYLFDPIGISEAMWVKTGNGVYQAGGGLFMEPRDMARFGFLYLNGGTWNGTQVVQQSWVLDSTDYQYALPPYEYYGYYWWHSPAMDVYQALGRFGQRIMVSPEEDLVVVFTASIQGMDYHPHEELYLDYILESIIGPPRTVTHSTSTTTTTNTSTSTTTGETNTGLNLLDGIYLSIGAVAIGVVVLFLIRYRRTT